MVMMKCAVLVMVMAFSNLAMMGSVLADDDKKEIDSKVCAAAVGTCATAAIAAGKGVDNAIKQCKGLRQCKKVCREVKGDCKKDARGDKKSCKDECRDRFQHGKDYRDCADLCRDEKKEAKGECREDKTDCKEECRDEYKTPECINARKQIISAGLIDLGACATVVQCVAQSTGNQK